MKATFSRHLCQWTPVICIVRMAALSASLGRFQKVIDSNYAMDNTSIIVTRLWWIPVASCFFYLLIVWFGKKWMDERDSFRLKRPLLVWNIFLATFSILGAVVELPPLVESVITDGFDYSVCNSEMERIPLLSFFALLFVFSKVVEFGDTFFIILRKTPLNFLHWYHHVTVCLFSWHSLAVRSAPAHWYCAMNFLVHSVMYSYYIVKASGVRMPKGVALSVTVLQLLQFATGFAVVMRSAWLFMNGAMCNTSFFNSLLGTTIYFSYFILFGNFFYQRYLKPKEKKIQ